MNVNEQEMLESITTKVMEWEVEDGSSWIKCPAGLFKKEHLFELWNPLQNITDAWRVVEKMIESGYQFELECKLGEYYARFSKEQPFQWGAAKSATEAICSAAYKAARGYVQ
ncbi:hypothetical protein P9578_28210 [Brevibacillus choshinensis]|uniref:BC1872 family protein n=1 Tax=Brevibacillus choshinensis TaxID=54911 RepID=UPI002E1A56B2|nr:hypothetical protein [Brevibacillus choshinensis]